MQPTSYFRNTNPETPIDRTSLIPAIHGRSEKYVAIDSNQLVDELTKNGFQLRQVSASKSRTAKGQMHLIRMTAPKGFGTEEDSAYPELIIRNSYDGSSPFVVSLGLFRQVCSNGLTIKTADFGDFKTRHIGEPAKIAKQLTMEFCDKLPEVYTQYQRLTGTIWTEEQVKEFAMKAAKLRSTAQFTDNDIEQLLASTRSEDEGNTVWAVFNRVQEKLQNGGYKLEAEKRTKKEVRNPWAIKNLNSGLFDIVAEMLDEGNNEPDITEDVAIQAAIMEVEEVLDVVPPKKVRRMVDGKRVTVDNPAYIEYLEFMEAKMDELATA